ncbi:MAG: DNA primase, partial [Ruminococcus sp.]|nr:DNA primase [Ruminococcus sp.]
VSHDVINPEASKHRKEARAEEIIICRLMRHPEEADKLRETAPPEIFVTQFNKKVYEALLNIADNAKEISLSIIGDEFSPDEMGKISGIQAKNRDMTISAASVADCANVLKNHKSLKTAEDISDDDIRNIFASKKS